MSEAKEVPKEVSDWAVGLNEVEALSQQIIQLANDTEKRGLPFVATSLRNLTSLIDAEYRVMQSLCQQL